MKQAVSILFVLLGLSISSVTWGQATCAQYSGPFGPFIDGHTDADQHLYGVHGSAFSASGQCIYTGTSGPCDVVARASQVSPSYSDSGLLKVPGYHVGNAAVSDGVSTSNGGSAVATSEGAVAFENCPSPGCAFSITISALGINFPPAAIWHDQLAYSNTCIAKAAAVCNSRDKSGCGQGGTSPLVLDIKGKGFIGGFTDPNETCVLYDLGDGKVRCYSWLKTDSGLAWLVLEDKDGKVELLGNLTPQPNHPSTGPNGFLALAEYDFPSNGGNWDLLIDKRDAVWNGTNPQHKKLRVWLDQHCAAEPGMLCQPRPGEMHTLEDIGLSNIDLVYSGDYLVDDVSGVHFKYQSHVNLREYKDDSGNSHHDQGDTTDRRMILDAYLPYKQ